MEYSLKKHKSKLIVLLLITNNEYRVILIENSRKKVQLYQTLLLLEFLASIKLLISLLIRSGIYLLLLLLTLGCFDLIQKFATAFRRHLRPINCIYYESSIGKLI